MENFFGDPYMMWHDGIDVTAVNRLSEEEKKKAEDMLIQEMYKGNYFAVQGLRELRSKKAIPVMKQYLNEADPSVQLEICITLVEQEGEMEYLDIIFALLLNCPSYYVRMTAAIELRKFNLPSVVEALFKAILDPDYLVRYHAVESLLDIHGFEPDITLHDDIMFEITFSEEDDVPREECLLHHERAVQLLKELFSRPPP